uniref:Hybrid signal transduction histidine kinase M n=1 Tax=Tanacetum cinerariifolium TaxID=118510 RepID=A0A6L2NPY8_TANCI|nr:hybrid signal transduction histidine kinase M [Tanacetum cinerariifolium]
MVFVYDVEGVIPRLHLYGTRNEQELDAVERKARKAMAAAAAVAAGETNKNVSSDKPTSLKATKVLHKDPKKTNIGNFTKYKKKQYSNQISTNLSPSSSPPKRKNCVEEFLVSLRKNLVIHGILGLKSHVKEDTASTNPDWCQLDDLIKMWILGSLCDYLQEQLVTTWDNAKALWDHLKELFHENKDARALNLDNELRDKNLVIYIVNGHDFRFATLVKIIRHRETRPTFETTRTILLLKESSFTDDSGATTTFESSSSSLTVLMISTSSSTKGNTNKPSTISQICNHFNRGTCKFRDRCKFIHDHRNRASLSSSRNPNCGNNSSLAGIWNTSSSAPPHYKPANPQNQSRPYTNYHPRPIVYYTSPSLTPYQAHPQVAHYQQPATPIHQQQQPTPQMVYQAQPQFVAQSQSGILDPASAFYSSQVTSLPNAFNTMSLQDPTWNMDIGATSHLYSNARNLSTLFNKRLFSSIHVGDGNSIPATNTGHSVIPLYHRPLHLHNVLVTPNIIKNLISVCQFTRDNNRTIEFDAFGFSVKDFLTRHILLRCDISGDLYLVTKPSTLLAAFVSTSSTTWHKRLGHPEDEVLLSLSSRQFISCNKAKLHMFVMHANLAPRAWFQWFAGYATRAGFSPTSSPVLLQQIVDSLHKEFDMTDLEALNYFLGISVVRHPIGLFLSQKKYALQLLERAHMANCNPSRTPVNTDSKLGPDGVPVCLYMHDPREPQFAALKRILRYVQGTLELGLHLYAFATTSLVGAKAEYQGVANVVAETAWIRNLLCELHSPLLTATLVYCDNVSAVYMLANPVQHQRTKHIEIDIHFVRDMVKADPQTIKAPWDLIAEIFNDNKHNRSIALKAELRSLKLEDLSIDAYFCKIESIATILTSLGSPISNGDVVTIALKGLPD